MLVLGCCKTVKDPGSGHEELLWLHLAECSLPRQALPSHPIFRAPTAPKVSWA